MKTQNHKNNFIIVVHLRFSVGFLPVIMVVSTSLLGKVGDYFRYLRWNRKLFLFPDALRELRGNQVCFFLGFSFWAPNYGGIIKPVWLGRQTQISLTLEEHPLILRANFVLLFGRHIIFENQVMIFFLTFSRFFRWEQGISSV